MKTLIAQTRAACATEVRKRDRQIDGLKKAVSDASRVRGGNKSRDVVSISVTGEIGGDDRGLPAGATESEGYSLRLETNEFLTELARGLSEENEGLLALVRHTVDGLRDMSGLERSAESVNGARASHRTDASNENGNGTGNGMTGAPQKSAEELATELETIMEHLRTILTNPSFVPIEEVEVREEVISRLRAGLETMESRWKDAVHMIDGWRNRMVSSGKSVDMDDLRMGLLLSPVKVRDVAETADVVPMRLSCVQEEEEEEHERYENQSRLEAKQERSQRKELQRLRSPSPVESLNLVSAPGYDAENEDENSESDSSSVFNDDIDIDELDAEEPNVQVLQESTYATSMDSPPLPLPPQLSPLKDSYSSGNRGSLGREYTRKRTGDFTTIIEEKTCDLVVEEEERGPVPPPHASKPQSPRQQQKTSPVRRSPPWNQDQSRPSSITSYDSPLFGKSGQRPSQSDPALKLFSKPTSLGQQVHAKSQPEPGTPNKQTPNGPRRPTTSRDSPDPSASDIKRTASEPNQQQRASTPSRQGSPATQPRPKSSSSLKSPTSAVQKQQQSLSRPHSPLRTATQGMAINVVTANASSRLPRPNSMNPPQSPLTMATIAAKLEASEREADAARVRAKLRAVRNSGQQRRTKTTPTATATAVSRAPAPAPVPSSPSPQGVQTRRERNSYTSVDPVKKDRDTPAKELAPSPVISRSDSRRKIAKIEEENGQYDNIAAPKAGEALSYTDNYVEDNSSVNSKPRRKRDPTRRTSKAASRRRSTLSPWELETLIQGAPSTPGAC